MLIRRIALTTGVMIALISAAASSADGLNAVMQIKIGPQALSAALLEFSDQTKLQVVSVGREVRGLRSPGVEGRWAARDALARLLEGTGLAFEEISDKTVRIFPRKTAEAAGVSPAKNVGEIQLAQAASSSAQPRPAGSESGAERARTPGSETESVNRDIGEITVTAQKRAERLIDVPLAVTAVTAAEIEARGITDLQNMQYAVPGLTLASTGSGVARVQMDGIGSTGGNAGLPVVGMYLDEVPITSLSGIQMDVRLLDMDRVEILHGPQPTLYGEGSMGGTIRYITASPDLEKVGGHFNGDWGSVADGGSSYRASAVLNAPLVERKLGMRVLAGYERSGGWIDSLTTGRRDVNSVDFKTARMKLLYRPSDALSISLMALHQEHDQDYENFGTPDRTTATGYPTANEQKSDVGNLVVSYDLGPAALLSSTGFLHHESDLHSDLTAYFTPFLPLFGLPPDVISSIEQIGNPTVITNNAFIEELRLSSNNSGPFNYVVGAYYRNYRTGMRNSTATAPGSLPFQLLGAVANNTSETWAVFGEVRYAVTDRLQALLGLRHFEDTQHASSTGLGILNIPGTSADRARFTSDNPRLNVSYKTSPNGLVYVNVAKGFRSGVFNLGAALNATPTAGPESLWTYTLGTKQEWLDRRVSVDLSVYYNDWGNLQSVGISSGVPLGYYANSGKASGQGANLALTMRPSQELSISATLGYTDMEHDVDSAFSRKGDPIDLVAKWTYSVAADYRRPLEWGATLISRIDLQHTSGYQNTLRGLPPEIFPTDSRNVLNARFGLDFGRYEAYLFGNNLTDDDGSLFPAVGAYPEPVVPMPRTVGIQLAYHFD